MRSPSGALPHTLRGVREAAEHVAQSRPVWPAYVAEGLTSLGTSVLMLGIFFYTEHHFGWGPRQNFLLAAAQGFVYVFAALLTHPISKAIGRRWTLIIVYTASGAVALAALAARTPLLVAITLCAYTFVNTISWPAVESLVSSGVGAQTLSRRIGIYNLVWSGMNGVGLGVSGALIDYWPAGMFIVPAVAHALSALLLLVRRDIEPPAGADAPAGHVAPEPELARVRTLALRLSRIALPATYVVIYSLMAMMPSLPVMQTLEPTWRTPLASVWIIARFITFLMLGATTWWHTRPMLLLGSAVVMLGAFIGVATGVSLVSLVVWQLVLGVVMGMIYSGSLYFGMVLSDGSTEHGGYHEALIGVGALLGPGAGALAQWLRPGDLRFGVAAVSAVVGASVVAAGIAAYRARSRQVGPPDPLPTESMRV